jgi:hypothetical protein
MKTQTTVSGHIFETSLKNLFHNTNHNGKLSGLDMNKKVIALRIMGNTTMFDNMPKNFRDVIKPYFITNYKSEVEYTGYTTLDYYYILENEEEVKNILLNLGCK